MKGSGVRSSLLMVVIALAGVRVAVAAEPVTVLGNDQTRDVDCQGALASVAGNENKITFSNCSRVVVTGNANKLVLTANCPIIDVMGNGNIAAADVVKSISTTGNDNNITWKAVAEAGKKMPAMSNLGKRNKITQLMAPAGMPKKTAEKTAEKPADKPAPPVVAAAVAAASGGDSGGGTIMINDDNGKITKTCGGRTVLISGDGNHIALKGECATVNVSGERNKVEVEAVAHIMISGEGNSLTWERGKDGKPPKVMKSGDNQVAQKKK